MANKNPDFLQCKEERKQEGFFKVFQSGNLSSEIMRAIPHNLARNFSDKDLSRKMKIKAQWGSSWEVKISKNPRFYYFEKSGWDKFVSDNALGDQEFITFTHKGKMRFTVNIFNRNGTEMIQRPQSRAFLASSSRVKTEQDVKKEEEVVVSSELSHRVPTTAAESNRGGMKTREINIGKKTLDGEFQSSKRTKNVVSARRNPAGASSSSSAELNIYISKSYLICLAIPKSFANDHMPKKRTMMKIHHPDGKKSWNVVYIVGDRQAIFSGGWLQLCKEYPLSIGNNCKLTFFKPKELLLVVTTPRETH